jgi:putative transcriptional regulator
MVMAKRDIFGEVVEGVAAMKSHREGKLTLRSYKVEVAPLPKVDSKLIRDTRKEAALFKSGVRTKTAH